MNMRLPMPEIAFMMKNCWVSVWRDGDFAAQKGWVGYPRYLTCSYLFAIFDPEPAKSGTYLS
jgi:hypothetical protein